MSDPGPEPASHPGPQPANEPGLQPANEPGPQPANEPGPQPANEPGLQPERTRLAWRRTILTATVVSILAARLAIGSRPTTYGMLGVAAPALLWLVVVGVSERRISALTATHPATARRTPAVLAATVMAYALLGAVLLALRGR